MQFFQHLSVGILGVFVFSVSLQFLSLAGHLLNFVVAPSSLPFEWAHLALALSGIISLGFVVFQLKARRGKFEKLQEVGERIEAQSRFFDEHPEHRSELAVAADFLEKNFPTEFERAHAENWDRRLGSYRIEIFPSLKLLWALCFVVPIFLISLEFPRRLSHQLPERIEAWNLSKYEQKLPYEGAQWEEKTGALSAVVGSEVRFRAPQFSFLQTYLFYRPEGGGWIFKACAEFCEFKVQSRGRYAVGSLLFRSAQFPLLAIPDEAPRAVIFLRENQDLVPNPTVSVLNKQSLLLHLMATDDLSLKSARLLHRFEGEQQVLMEKDLQGLRYKEDFQLNLEDWKGGRHEVVLEVEDYIQKQESSPLVILFADEEFLRQQRLLSLRTLLDQWMHVLADLLESEADRRVHPQLVQRIEEIEWPGLKEDDEADANARIFVRELQRLAERISRDLELIGISKLPELIRDTEKQLLYGLSLILQEKAGDLQASTQGIQNSQQDLQRLIDDIRKGDKELTPEAVQEAFEKLARQLEELQEKIKNLPQGPSDDLINREALQEQLNESEELQERIAQIQEQIANGNQEQALKELESMINQLSILSKEMERSFNQWQENLAQGAMQSSEAFENQLKEIRERQENLAKKTEELEKRKVQKMQEARDRSLKPAEYMKSQEELKKEFEALEEEQAELQEEFEQAQKRMNEQLQGSEWEQVFRSSEAQELEQEISERMQQSEDSLRIEEGPEAISQQLEASELLRKAEEAQQKMRQNVKKMAQPQESEGRTGGRTEIIESEGRGERERRQKIMNSLRQKVDDPFQKSHERYFEELLQR